MRFFNQIEKKYLNDFVNQHHNLSQTYFRPFTLRTLSDFIEEGVYRNSYFFMRGMVALFNAGVSICKVIAALFSFSFKDAKLAALNTGYYLASWMIKHGFCVISTCLDIVQLFSKTASAYFDLFKFVFFARRHRRSNAVQRFGKELDSLSAYMDEVYMEKDSIINMICQYYKQSDAWCDKYICRFLNSSQKQNTHRMTIELEEMQRNLFDALKNYPDLTGSETTAEDVVFVHRELREHHANVCELASAFYKEFDAYLRLVDSVKCLKEEPRLSLSY